MPDPARVLDWDDFRLIKAVAATRGLPAAAARLGVAHSTVFRRLGRIEALLGTPLFERHRDGFTPTAAGEEMTALSARLDEDITAVTRRLAGQAPSPAGEVRLATSDSLLDLMMPMLARVRVSCPAIRLDIVTGNPALNLSRRDADIAVRATAQPPDTLVGRRLARIAWAVYGTPGNLSGAEANWVSPGDNLSGLAAFRFIQGEVPSERVAAKLDTVLGLARAIEAGIGIGHLPCFVGDRSARLVRLAAPDPAYAADLWLLTHADLRHTPRVRALLDALAAEIGAVRGLIEGAEPRQARPPVLEGPQ